MKASWLNGLEKQREIDVRQNFKESLVIRKRLVEMLTETIESSRKVQISKGLYDNPNWSYVQADRTGYERAIRDIIDLILD
jgi:hypothetical protein